MSMKKLALFVVLTISSAFVSPIMAQNCWPGGGDTTCACGYNPGGQTWCSDSSGNSNGCSCGNFAPVSPPGYYCM